MTNQKLLTFAVAGLLAPALAHAEVGNATKFEIIPAPTLDLAPTTGEGPNERLKKTDQEQPGNEMAAFAMFNGTSGLFFSMATELNGTAAPNKMQLAMVPFQLVKDASGAITAAYDNTPGKLAPKFVTNNNGNETRNANHPTAVAISGGAAICAFYNYQQNGTNDTKRYAQCFDQTGKTIMPQTQIFARNNDDCSMSQDGAQESRPVTGADKLSNRFVAWRGCNGNGADDGWMQNFSINVTLDASGNATAATYVDHFAVSVCPREERSHGYCSLDDADPNTAICTWTEGNTQPQRDGTWLAAIDITPGAHNGQNDQGSILWKQQVEGRIEQNNLTTYSMRAMHQRVYEVAPAGTTGVSMPGLVASNKIIWRSGDLKGNNNNNEKGGAYYRNKMAVMQINRLGMDYVVPMADLSNELDGLDGTHLNIIPALFGTTDALQPGVMFLSGSHTGGGTDARARVAVWDAASNSFKDGSEFGIAPHDRHLYPNYLGNNPGNQGRNYSHAEMVANPFTPGPGEDAYLMLFATTGKANANMTDPRKKLSAFLTVLPIAQNKAADPVDPVTPEPTDPTTPEPTDDGEMPGSDSVGGCSTGNSTGGLLTFLALGFVALIRRRRTA